jgi:hypothetical protein
LVVREFDKRLDLSQQISDNLTDARRDKAEQWIKEDKQGLKMTRLSCYRFRSKEVRLWLDVIACNLGNLLRRLVLPKRSNRGCSPACSRGC